MAENDIKIVGAREHNLAGVDLVIPRDKFVVFTGVSGSGKSSLAFDTLYAEGQRRYVESLSAYARQFLDVMEKPKVDRIEGLSPAIAIEQKSAGHNPRSTVATITEVYDYLRVLFARAGTVHCYKCGREIQSQGLDQMVDRALAWGEGARLQILAPLVRERKGEYRELFANARKQGFARVRVNGQVLDLSDEIALDERRKHRIELVVDRVLVKPTARSRIAESVETALRMSNGLVILSPADGGQEVLLSRDLSCPDCGVNYPEITPQMFSFNNPQGRCEACDGLGTTLEMDPSLVAPNPDLSLRQGAIPVLGDPDSPPARNVLEALERSFNIDLGRPWKDISTEQQRLVLYGSGAREIEFVYRTRHGRVYRWRKKWEGVIPSNERKFKETSSEEMRQYYTRFIAPTPCPACNGSRLRPEALFVKIGGKSIHDLTRMAIDHAYEFFSALSLDPVKTQITADILKEIKARLHFMIDVGIGYLTLDRSAPTLAGGETQRIRLATQIGSGLVGVLYILDEPTIGLHQRDNAMLIATLKRLRDLGNTVVVVEHDLQTICSADFIVDFGPGAGTHGGRVVVAGPIPKIKRCPGSVTGQFLAGKRTIPLPARRRGGNGRALVIEGATHNNLKNLTVEIPLGCFVCVTGVSGSGKSSLVTETLYPAVARRLHHARLAAGACRALEGLEFIDKIISIDQDPIGRTPRSNPATYVGVFGPIRDIFAQTPEARQRGYAPGRFSFNVPGGRCDDCEGDGVKRIEMLFLPDVFISCQTCKGNRYNRETLEVRYKGKNIAQVLDMTVDEAIEHFGNIPRIKRMLQTLVDVGLGYIKLGQPAPTLSGGEAQRVKLAKELSRRDTGSTLYLLDEPTTGLHLADVEKLLGVLNALVDLGNTVVVIEHNLEVVKVADWVIDLGPEGGDKGGEVVTAGPPEAVTRVPESYTGQFLRDVLKGGAGGDGRSAKRTPGRAHRAEKAPAQTRTGR
jgi:excinuclease ABC subunit A